jgi:cytochrome subunit of sulfide dehydrogenase
MYPITKMTMATLALLAAQIAQAQDNTAARSLAATCANCHGTQGAARGEMKALAGAPAAATVAKMAAFKAGTLPATVMHQIAKGYSDEQIALVATYFEAQKPAK